VNFYIGNNPHSDGYTAIVPGTPGDWEGGYKATIRIAEEAAGRELKPSEVSGYWFRRAWSEMSADPSAWATLTLRKINLLLSGHEIGNNDDIYFQRRFSWLLGALMWERIIAFPFGIILPLGFLGLALQFSWRKNSLLIFFFLSYMISIVAFFVCTRYRLPLIPILAIWSGVAIVEIYGMAKNKAIKSYIIPLLGSVLLFIAVNRNPLRGEGIPDFEGVYYLGNKYLTLKEYPQAERAFREAVTLDPSSALARNGLGMSLLYQGRGGEAKKEFEKAVRTDPGFIPAYNNLARLLQQEGNLQAALEQFKTVLNLDSADVFARRGFADVALKRGDYVLAEEHYQIAYALGAQDRQLISRWAQALMQQRKYADALEVNARLLALEPDNARAHHNQARIYIACDSLEQAARELEVVLRLDPRNLEAKKQLEEISGLIP
jgi:tetratricopeptide (TPR) repeat protein